MTEEPVDIELRLLQDIDTEGKKATESIDNIAAHSDRAQKSVSGLGAQVSGAGKKFSAGAAGVVDMTKRINGLNYSMQQVARELPNIAISPQLFIMAISNNLPILQDEINKTRAANEALKASGQSTVPVWKQMIKGLFSWQTALIAGITIMTVYGKEIFSFIGKMLKSEDAISKAKKAQEEYNKTTREGVKGAQEQITKLDLLYRAATDTAKGQKERNDAIAELQKMFPAYLGNIDAETIKLGQAKTAYDNLRQSIIDAAIAKAYQKKITEAQTKIIELEAERNRKIIDINKYISNSVKVGKTKGGNTIAFGFSLSGATDAQKRIKEIDKEIADLTNQIKKYGNSINISDLIFGSNNNKDVAKNAQQAADELKKKLTNSELDLSKAVIAIMQDGLDKQKALRKQAYEEQLADIDKNEKDYIDKLNTKLGKKPNNAGYVKSLSDYINLNPSDKEAAAFYKNINDQRLLADQKYVKDSEKLDSDAAKQRKKIWEQASDAILSSIEKEKQAINSKYDDLIENATKLGATQGDIDKLNELRVKALTQVQSDAVLKLSTFYQKVFGDIQRYGVATLKSLKEQMDAVVSSAQQISEGGRTLIQVSMPTGEVDANGKEIMKTVNMTIEEFIRFKQQLVTITNQLADDNPFAVLGDSLNQLISKLKSGSKEEISDSLKDFATNAQKAVDEIRQVGSTIGGEFGKAIDLTAELAQGMITLAAGIASGNPVAILQGGAQVYDALTRGAKEYHDAQKQWINDLIDLQLQYNAVLNDQIRLQDSANVFITDYVSSAANASQALIDAQVNLVKSLKGNSLSDALGSLSIQTGTKKKTAWYLGLLGGVIPTGAKKVYSELGDAFSSIFPNAQFSDLVDEAGNLNVELANTVLNSGLLNDESQNLLKTWIEYQDEINAANEAIKQSVEDLAGQLGSDLASALRGAWDDGTSGFQAFKNTVSSGLEDIVSQIIFNSVFSDTFTKLQNDLTKALTSGGDIQSIIDAYQQFYANAADNVDLYNQMMDVNNQAAQAAGFDFSSTTRTGSTKGIAQASQDSVDELNGRFTAIQALTLDIRTNSNESLALEKEAANHRLVIQSQLDTIAENSDYLKHLKKIRDDINTMVLLGIKLKN